MGDAWLADDVPRRIADASEVHGDEEGSLVAVGDLEVFLTAAWALLTPPQRLRFWDDPRVRDVVTEVPEYAALAAEVYGGGSP